jgi:sortase A
VIATAIAVTALALSAPAAPPAAGAPVATISIPAIGLHALVREGIGATVLDRGPGHYPGTSLPGGGGVVGIAGHRVTHTRPFLRINELRRGQRIVLTRNGRRYVYRVTTMRVVAPTDVWPIRTQRAHETLVLTACHPPTTDLRRLVVFAHLDDGP